MKKTIWICFLCLVLFLQSCRSTYKVIESKGIGEFIIPPDTYWGYKENGEKKYGYDRYYYVLFCGLSKNYLNSISALNKTQSWSGNDDYFKKEFNKLERKAKAKGEKVEFLNLSSYIPTSNFFKCSTINNQKSGYLIQIDYDALIIKGDEKQTTKNFSELTKDLLIEISEKENQYDWPTSVSQNIIEKVFEHIPIPQEASLARYGLIQETSFSLLPLNPKIHLRVDHSTLYDSRTTNDVAQLQQFIDKIKGLIDTANIKAEHSSEIVNIPIDTLSIISAIKNNSWRFQFTGQSIISYTKFQYDNNDVFFKFDPFLSNSFNRTGTTNNYPNSSIRFSASSIDIDFTTELNKTKYLILFQKYLRGNNTNSLPEDDEYYQCCRKSAIGCNSLILYRNNLSDLATDFNDCDSVNNFTVFGERSPIVPLILIEINSSKVFIPIGYTIFDLIANGYINTDYKFKREFSGTTKTFKNSNSKIILLPGDIIKSY